MSETTTKRYCSYCKEKTKHVVESSEKNSNESGRCLGCGSAGLTKIQGFNANLM